MGIINHFSQGNNEQEYEGLHSHWKDDDKKSGLDKLIEGNHRAAEQYRIAYGKVMYNKAINDIVDWVDEVRNSPFFLSAPENELKMLDQFKAKCLSFKK